MSISMKSVKIGTGILSAAMSLTCIGNLPVMASKPEPLDKNEFNTMLGTSGMSYPAIPDDSDSDWEGSYVFG